MPRPKKVLVVMSSPRPKGNSSILAAEAGRGAEEAGAVVRAVRLAELAFGPCRACDKCREPGAKGCVQDDDMKALRAEVKSADALLIASPVYWFTMGGLAKLFMDRLYVFGAGDYRELKGKRVGLILASGDSDLKASGAINAVRSFQDAFAYLGAPIAGLIHCGGGRAGAARRNKALMKEAYDLGRALAAGSRIR
jgi:multimeric flavodoxin WrbA